MNELTTRWKHGQGRGDALVSGFLGRGYERGEEADTETVITAAGN